MMIDKIRADLSMGTSLDGSMDCLRDESPDGVLADPLRSEARRAVGECMIRKFKVM